MLLLVPAILCCVVTIKMSATYQIPFTLPKGSGAAAPLLLLLAPRTLAGGGAVLIRACSQCQPHVLYSTASCCSDSVLSSVHCTASGEQRSCYFASQMLLAVVLQAAHSMQAVVLHCTAAVLVYQFSTQHRQCFLLLLLLLLTLMDKMNLSASRRAAVA